MGRDRPRHPDGRGETRRHPPAVVWFANTEAGDKAGAKAKPNDLLGTFAQKFLGQRLQCAECLNHPFTGFKQDDFWPAAALVSRVSFLDSDKKALRKNRAVPTVKNTPAGRLAINIPETTHSVAAKYPDGSPLPTGSEVLRPIAVRPRVPPRSPTHRSRRPVRGGGLRRLGHPQGQLPRTKALSTELDAGMSALLADLKQRGLLKDTLVVWMGDVGRPPT